MTSDNPFFALKAPRSRTISLSSERRSDTMFRLRSMLPWAALGLAAMLGGCVAYPAYPGYPAYGYGYGYAAPPVVVGGYYGGWHGGGWRR
jgi:hypothetical protein